MICPPGIVGCPPPLLVGATFAILALTNCAVSIGLALNMWLRSEQPRYGWYPVYETRHTRERWVQDVVRVPWPRGYEPKNRIFVTNARLNPDAVARLCAAMKPPANARL